MSWHGAKRKRYGRTACPQRPGLEFTCSALASRIKYVCTLHAELQIRSYPHVRASLSTYGLAVCIQYVEAAKQACRMPHARMRLYFLNLAQCLFISQGSRTFPFLSIDPIRCQCCSDHRTTARMCSAVQESSSSSTRRPIDSPGSPIKRTGTRSRFKRRSRNK